MSRFEDFWAVWPRKVAKRAAEKAWEKGGCDEVIDQILRAVKWQKKNWSDPKFIPHPSTWLNQGRWDDQPPEVTTRERAVESTLAKPPQTCGYEAQANMLLLRVLDSIGGVSPEVVPVMVDAKRKLAQRWREIGHEIPIDEQREIMRKSAEWLRDLGARAERHAKTLRTTGTSQERPTGSPPERNQPRATPSFAQPESFVRAAESEPECEVAW